MKIFLNRAIFFFFCLLLLTAWHGAPLAHARPDRPLIPATVLSVHDGDTITVMVGGRRERVRLIGVDTPEIEPNGKFRRDVRRDTRHTPDRVLELGREARAFTARLAPPGSEVGLEQDVSERDRYGRLLAYVWVKSPQPPFDKGGQGGISVDKRGVMLNAALLRAGMGMVMTVPPNVARAGYFRGLQRRARMEGRGFWR